MNWKTFKTIIDDKDSNVYTNETANARPGTTTHKDLSKDYATKIASYIIKTLY